MKRIASILSTLILVGNVVYGQQPERERSGPRPGDRGERPGPRPGAGMRVGRDLVIEHLFAPELLRRFAEQLGLSEEQKAALKQEMDKSRDQLEQKQKNVREQVQTLAEILKPAKVEEAAAAAQMDKVLAAEEAVKKDHLMLLVRVKNILTAEQQAKLVELRKEHLPRPAERPPQAPKP